MLVHQILKLKSSDEVVCVSPGTSISQAAKVLAERRIGTVVVSSDGVVAEGILSERDIVHGLAARGGESLSDPVERHMTSRVVTCHRDDKSDDILTQMTEGRFRHMPVVENGKLVGLITLGDVVKAQLTQLAMEKTALEGMIMGH